MPQQIKGVAMVTGIVDMIDISIVREEKDIKVVQHILRWPCKQLS